ncbi:unnamed protein product [Rhizophagus irregularis]|nr:unnamed protein product [Rhizophagus irregularis]
MENQDSSVNTEATTVDEINIGPIGNTQSKEKSSIPESERPSLVNLRNLGYNILKSLEDKTRMSSPDCEKSVDILDKAGIISNLNPRVTSQSSEISPSIGTFALSLPLIQMLGIEGPVSQQDKSPSKLLVYLTCKHIIHYNCIDNPRKLCPICPSTDMEIDDLETPTEQSSSTAQKKCSSEFASEKDSNKKAKQTRKQIDRDESPTLKF